VDGEGSVTLDTPQMFSVQRVLAHRTSRLKESADQQKEAFAKSNQAREEIEKQPNRMSLSNQVWFKGRRQRRVPSGKRKPR
jgi:hypothetical protein